ncbi:hypothetical protein [Compostibacter hankyongensis]|uniref:Uncharacterized protein n=1 Tax=Compostibacter hankyongensis TaxID=1007089 RepID=A0ABP8FS55_9BACT
MDRAFNIFKKDIHLDYKKPNGFEELDSTSHFMCGRNVWVNPFVYNLINHSKDIVIAVQMWSYKDLKQLEDDMSYYGIPVNSANANYLRDIEFLADTVHSQVIYYPPAYVKKKFNADDAGEYLLNCPYLYRKKYAHCQVVFLHKKKRGDLQLFYYYTDDAKEKIEKCIHKTAGMIRYQ